MASKPKITEKEYKKVLKVIKAIKSYGGEKTAVSLIKKLNKIAIKFEKQNKHYKDYVKLNSQYNSLRYRVNKQHSDYAIISGEFPNAPNPWSRKAGNTPMKYEGKKTLKNLINEINSVKELWSANDLKVYGKDNNIQLLIKTALMSDKNYADFIGSEGWKAIKKDEEAHGGKDTEYISELRITFMIDKIKTYVAYNPKLFPNAPNDKINKILKKELSRYDKEFPEENLLKIFTELLEKGEI